MRVDPRNLDLDAIVHAPLRRQSRARALLNLLILCGLPLGVLYGGLRLAGVVP